MYIPIKYYMSPPKWRAHIYLVHLSSEPPLLRCISTNSRSFNQPQKVVISGVMVSIFIRCVLKTILFCRLIGRDFYCPINNDDQEPVCRSPCGNFGHRSYGHPQSIDPIQHRGCGSGSNQNRLHLEHQNCDRPGTCLGQW